MAVIPFICHKNRMKTAIQAELPHELLSQAKAFVEQGWAGDMNELLAEALRRYYALCTDIPRCTFEPVCSKK